jgi:ZIP family zinc transporter
MVVFLLEEVPSNAHMAFILSLAAGVMLSVTMMDIVIPSLLGGSSQDNVIHVASFVVGIVLFHAFTLCVPWIEEVFDSPSLLHTASKACQSEPIFSSDMKEASRRRCQSEDISRESSTMSCPPTLFRRCSLPAMSTGNLHNSARRVSMPAIPTFQKKERARRASVLLVAQLLTQKTETERRRKEKLHVAVMLATILTLHNLPEGLAVAISTSDSPTVGFTMMLAIALHNIPEGICVAATAFESTRNRWQAIRMSLYSGLSEPLGALLAIFLFGDKLATAGQYIMTGVAGMMCAVTFFELLPDAYRHCSPLSAVCGFALGVLVMVGTISVLDS